MASARHTARVLAANPAFSAAAVITLALATGRMVEGYLVGVSPADPLAYAVVIALLATSAALASYLPARRAAAADPLLVLRHD